MREPFLNDRPLYGFTSAAHYLMQTQGWTREVATKRVVELYCALHHPTNEGVKGAREWGIILPRPTVETLQESVRLLFDSKLVAPTPMYILGSVDAVNAFYGLEKWARVRGRYYFIDNAPDELAPFREKVEEMRAKLCAATSPAESAAAAYSILSPGIVPDVLPWVYTVGAYEVRTTAEVCQQRRNNPCGLPKGATYYRTVRTCPRMGEEGEEVHGRGLRDMCGATGDYAPTLEKARANHETHIAALYGDIARQSYFRHGATGDGVWVRRGLLDTLTKERDEALTSRDAAFKRADTCTERLQKAREERNDLREEAEAWAKAVHRLDQEHETTTLDRDRLQAVAIELEQELAIARASVDTLRKERDAARGGRDEWCRVAQRQRREAVRVRRALINGGAFLGGFSLTLAVGFAYWHTLGQWLAAAWRSAPSSEAWACIAVGLALLLPLLRRRPSSAGTCHMFNPVLPEEMQTVRVAYTYGVDPGAPEGDKSAAVIVNKICEQYGVKAAVPEYPIRRISGEGAGLEWLDHAKGQWEGDAARRELWRSQVMGEFPVSAEGDPGCPECEADFRCARSCTTQRFPHNKCVSCGDPYQRPWCGECIPF